MKHLHNKIYMVLLFIQQQNYLLTHKTKKIVYGCIRMKHVRGINLSTFMTEKSHDHIPTLCFKYYKYYFKQFVLDTEVLTYILATHHSIY